MRNEFELQQKLKSLPGFRIQEKTERFYIIKYVFDENFDEIEKFLESELKKETAFTTVLNREQVDKLLYEITRKLYNYISSAFSLVDQTRVYFREIYISNEFELEYDEEIKKRFKENDLAVFIKDFRHYLQHWKIPNLELRTPLNNELGDFYIKLIADKDTLLEFSGWKKLSKTFIANNPDGIEIRKTINHYNSLVNDFYSWFLNRQKELHKEELQKVQDLLNQIKKTKIFNVIDQFVKTKNYGEFNFEKNLEAILSQKEKEIFINSPLKIKCAFVLSLIQINKFPIDEKLFIKKYCS